MLTTLCLQQQREQARGARSNNEQRATSVASFVACAPIESTTDQFAARLEGTCSTIRGDERFGTCLERSLRTHGAVPVLSHSSQEQQTILQHVYRRLQRCVERSWSLVDLAVRVRASNAAFSLVIVQLPTSVLPTTAARTSNWPRSRCRVSWPAVRSLEPPSPSLAPVSLDPCT